MSNLELGTKQSAMESFGFLVDVASPSVVPTAFPQPFPVWSLVLIQVMLGTMTLLNSVGFGIIVFGTIKFRSELTPSQIITLSLGLSQIALGVVMIVCLPYVMDVCRLDSHGQILCGIALLVGFSCNVFLHTIIHSLDLCVKIRSPFTYIRRMTEKRALLFVVISWVLGPSIGGAIVPFLHFDEDHYKIECLIMGMELLYKIPFLFFYNSINLVLLSLVFFPTILVVRTARKHAIKIRQQEEMLHGVFERNGRALDDDISRMNRLIARRKRLIQSRPTSGKAITDFLIFVSSFILAWIALMVGIDVVVFSQDDNLHKINILTGLVFLVYNQCAIGILIYTHRQPDCRKTRQLLKRSVAKTFTRLRNAFKE